MEDRHAQDPGRRIRKLLRVGIRSFVSLIEKGEMEEREDVPEFLDYTLLLPAVAGKLGVEATMTRLAIRDMGVPSRPKMKLIQDCLNRTTGSGVPTYVHCWAGHGRTGQAVGVWMIEHGLATARNVVQEIARLRTGLPGRSPQTAEQVAFVKTYRRGRTAEQVAFVKGYLKAG